MFRLFPRPACTAAFALLFLCSGCGSQDAGETGSRGFLGELEQGLVVMDAVDPGHRTCGGLLGAGWHPAEGGRYAWTSAGEAFLELPVENTAADRFVLVGYGLGAPGNTRRLEVLVNGYSLGVQDLPLRPERVEWALPPHRLRRGLNAVILRVDRTVTPAELGRGTDGRSLGVLVEWLGVLDGDREPDLDAYIDEDPRRLVAGRWRAACLAHGAGQTCELAWTGDRPLRVRVARRLGGAPELEAVLEATATGSGTIDLPHDLAPGSWLMVGGEAGELTDATLVFRFRPTDVLLIVVDTLRPDYLGCYGAGPDASPAVDALAADGILFEQALCHSPITGPSHANLFTSLYPSDTGVLNNARRVVPAGLSTAAEILAERGWDTRAAVSISPIESRWGYGRGFGAYDDRLGDTWILRADTMITRIEALRRGQAPPRFLFAHFADPHEPYDAHGLIVREAEVVRGGEVLATIPTSTYTPTRLDLDLYGGTTEIVLRSEHPFRLRNVGLRDAEGMILDTGGCDVVRDSCTLRITASAAGRAGLVLQLCDILDDAAPLHARYGREVAFTDLHVGMILDSLRAEGRYDETLIVFTADHGEALGEHGYLGHVQTLYETMMRVPLIIKPRRGSGFAAGERRMDQAALVDVLPTILARLGLPPLPGARGRDLLADGAAAAPTAIFMETHKPEAARDLYGLRTDGYKIIHEPDTGAWEFYDLAADPGERENLADRGGPGFEEHRDLLLGMLAQLDQGAGRVATEAEVDERTAEMLRSLGY